MEREWYIVLFIHIYVDAQGGEVPPLILYYKYGKLRAFNYRQKYSKLLYTLQHSFLHYVSTSLMGCM